MALALDSIETQPSVTYHDSIDAHLPVPGKGVSPLDVHLPQYYRETFFSNDTLCQTEVSAGRYGVAGDPVPYQIYNDHAITSLLLAILVLFIIAYAYLHEFTVREAKRFFMLPHEHSMSMTMTGTELRVQLFLVVLDCILIALLFYFYTLHFIADTFILKSDYYLIGIYALMLLAYFVVKAVVYTVVNVVFFGSKRNRHWLKTKLLLTSFEVALFYPIVLLQVYFDLPEENVVIFFIIVLIFVKILTFFKCYVSFFNRNVFSLQIILYFCALEIAPLLVLSGVWLMIVNLLKVNF